MAAGSSWRRTWTRGSDGSSGKGRKPRPAALLPWNPPQRGGNAAPRPEHTTRPDTPNALLCGEANRTRRHGVTWLQRGGKRQQEAPRGRPGKRAWERGADPHRARPSSRDTQHRARETWLLLRRIPSTRSPRGISKPHPKIQNFTHLSNLEVLVATCSNVSYNIG